MPDPEITPDERNVRKVFWSGSELAVHIARLSVLFEDLRLESTAASYTEPPGRRRYQRCRLISLGALRKHS
jgi:hypothetical protein